MSNEVTLGIRITADGKGASAEVKTVTGDIDKLGQSATKTTSESQRLNDALRNQTSQMVSASQAFKQNSEAVTRTSDSVTKLIDRYDPLSAKLRQLQADFKALDQAASSGKIAGIDDTRLDAAYAKIQAEIKAAQAAVSGFGATANAGFVHAAEGAEKAAFSTVGARRELMVLGHEAMSGNFSRIPGSMMVLAERTNFSMAAIFGLGGAITAVVGVVAAFAIAAKMGADESDAYARALVLTGNAAGETAGGLQVMAGNVAAATGATQHFAAEVLAELASGGQVAADGLQQAAQAAIDLERVGGPAAEESVKQFNELGKSPVEASLKLNDSTHYLTESVYLQIKALEDQGNQSAAAALAQSSYASAVEQSADELRASLGTLQRSWIAVKDAAKGAIDTMMNIGRPANLDEAQAKLDKLQQTFAVLQKGNSGGLFFDAPHVDLAPIIAEIAAQQKYVDGLKASSSALAAAATAKAELNKQQQAAIAFDQQGEKYLDKTAQMWREISKAEIEGTAAGKSQAEIMQRIGEIQAKYADKVPAAGKAAKDSYDSVYGSISKLNAELLASSETQDHLTRAQKVALDTMVGIQNGSIKLTEAEKIRVSAMLESVLALDKQATAQKAAQVAGEAYRKEIEAQDAAVQKANDSLSAEIDKLKMHGEEIGLSKDALDALILSRQDDAIAIAEQTLAKKEESDASAQELIDLNKSITLLKERRDVLASNQMKQSGADAAAASTAEWQKGWEETDKLARKVFDAWGVKGSNAAKQIGDTLKTALFSAIYAATIRPIAFQIYGSLTGGQSGSVGAPGALSGAGGNYSSMMSAGNTASGLYNTAGQIYSTGSLFGTSAAYGAGVSGLAATGATSQAAMLAAQTGEFGAAGLAATAEAGGGVMAAGAGLMGTLAAVAPYLAAIYAIYTIFSSPGGGPKTEGGAVRSLDANGNVSDFSTGNMYSDSRANNLGYNGNSAANDLVGLTLTSLNEFVKGLGGSAAGVKAGIQYSTDPQGTAQDMVASSVTDASGNVVYSHANNDLARGSYQTEVQTEAKRVLLAGIGASDVAPIFKAIVSGLGDIGAASSAMLDATMAHITDANTVMQYTKADPLQAVMDQIAQNASGATGALQRNNDALMALVSTYDGSAAATKNLAAATQNQYAMELSLIGQIQNALASTHDMFATSTDAIKMSVMDDSQKYDYLRSQADALYKQLATATDPAQIQGLAEKINTTINSAYNMLGADQQKGAAGGYVDYINKVEQLTDERLNKAQDQIVQGHDAIVSAITTAMGKAATDMAAAVAAAVASAAAAAAAAPKAPLVISFNSNVPGTTELGFGG